jgi:hypothetical protein
VNTLEIARLVATWLRSRADVPESAWALVDVVEQRLTSTPEGRSALDFVRVRPDDPARQQALAAELDRLVAADRTFARAVGDCAGGDMIEATGSNVVNRSWFSRIDNSRRRRITLLCLSLTVVGTATAVLLLPGTPVSEQPAREDRVTEVPKGETSVTPSAGSVQALPAARPDPAGPGDGARPTGTRPSGTRPTGVASTSSVPVSSVPTGTVPEQTPDSTAAATRLDLAKGLPGTSANVYGTGYEGCDTVRVLWDGQDTGVTTGVAPDGTFAARFTVPESAAAGTHDVHGRCASGESARSVFTVSAPPVVAVDPARGRAGSAVTVRGTGFDGCPDYGGGTVAVAWDGRAPAR